MTTLPTFYFSVEMEFGIIGNAIIPADFEKKITQSISQFALDHY
jgi:hypothetical protein